MSGGGDCSVNSAIRLWVTYSIISGVGGGGLTVHYMDSDHHACTFFYHKSKVRKSLPRAFRLKT